MIKTNAIVSVFSILLAATAPSAFADKGKGGGHHGRNNERAVRFSNNDRDDDRNVRRRVIVTSNADRDMRRRVIVTSNTDRRFVRRGNMRFRGLDANGDGRITRREWRGNANSFRVHDRNRDGVLSGREVWAGSHRNRR